MRTQEVDTFIKALEEGRQGRSRLTAFGSADWRCPDDVDDQATATARLWDLFTDPNPGPSGLLWVERQLNDDLPDVGGPLCAVTGRDAESGVWSGTASSRSLRRLTCEGLPHRADAESTGAMPAAR